MGLAARMQAVKSISPWQFAFFRLVLGSYLCVHFLLLIPYGAELFSDEGIFRNASSSPLYGLFPNLLAWLDSPSAVSIFLWASVVLSLSLLAGYCRRLTAFLLWYAWTCLFNRNLLISNPSLPYVGLTLLLCVLLPTGDRLAVGTPPGENWRFPRQIYNAAFFLLMLGYTFSGFSKLNSPSWINGDAMGLLLDNPLARLSWIRDGIKELPVVFTRILTWGALTMEVVALPLCFWRRGRIVAWSCLLAMQFGILAVINFSDLTFGMVIIHLFTLDPEWFPPRIDPVRRIVWFDGKCGLCDRFVKFLLGEDKARILLFAPLQGIEAVQILPEEHRTVARTVVYTRDSSVLLRSDAVLGILDDMGGWWRVVSWLGRFSPRAIRDRFYDLVARYRFHFFGRVEYCRIAKEEEKSRLLF